MVGLESKLGNPTHERIMEHIEAIDESMRILANASASDEIRKIAYDSVWRPVWQSIRDIEEAIDL